MTTVRVTNKDFRYAVSFLKKRGFTFDGSSKTWSGEKEIDFLVAEGHVEVVQPVAVETPADEITVVYNDRQYYVVESKIGPNLPASDKFPGVVHHAEAYLVRARSLVRNGGNEPFRVVLGDEYFVLTRLVITESNSADRPVGERGANLRTFAPLRGDEALAAARQAFESIQVSK